MNIFIALDHEIEERERKLRNDRVFADGYERGKVMGLKLAKVLVEAEWRTAVATAEDCPPVSFHDYNCTRCAPCQPGCKKPECHL